MRWLFLIFALATPCLAQQPWSNVLTSSRAINWQTAGLPASFLDKGGSNTETTTNPWTPPTRTQCGSTVNPSGVAATDLANINNAYSACSDGQYVLLGSGNFLIQGNIPMYAHSATIRGGGAQSTKLSISGSGGINMGAASSGGSCNLTSGSNYSAGSTTITCTGLTGSTPAVGNVAYLNQCDTGFTGNPCTGTATDNGGLWVCMYYVNCMSETSATPRNNDQYQEVVITSVSNASGTYTIGISSGLYLPNWAFGLTPTLTWNSSTYDGIGMGLEDLTIYSATDMSSIQLQNAYASWVKGVRFAGFQFGNFTLSKNCLLMNNYFFASLLLNSTYPSPITFYQDSDNLLLNNIMTSGVPWEGFGGNEGNVIAYNYGRDTFTLYVEDSFFDHLGYSAFDLFEGNELGVLDEDDTWGTHDLNTHFRNLVEGWDPPYTTYTSANSRAMQVENYQRFTNLIGNAIGTSATYVTNYQSSSGASAFQINTGDALTAASLMRWGNVSIITQGTDTPANSGVRFVSGEVPNTTNMPSGTYPNAVTWQNSTPSNNNLPCSFFGLVSTGTSCTIKPSGGTGLSWWKVCKTWTTFPTTCATTQTQPFPIAGPDQTSGPYVNGYAYDNPAQVAWMNLPVDSTYQNSYTITGSSWSGGIETLTISGLPDPTHLLGAFQLSGVNAACSSGATFGNNAEILMTGSSTTTAQYAITSNPGVSCTGTMKFPDVRQFDERVFAADTTATGSTSAVGVTMTGSALH